MRVIERECDREFERDCDRESVRERGREEVRPSCSRPAVIERERVRE